MRPFKTPSIVKRTPSNTAHDVSAASEPPPKKRRIALETDDDGAEIVADTANILKKPKPASKFQAPAPRKVLDVIENPSSSAPCGTEAKNAVEGYYTVLW